MSSARRAYDLIRGYVNHGWEKVAHDEEGRAHEELRQAIAPAASREHPSPSLSSSVTASGPPDPPITLEQARHLFDLTPSATSKQITEAYDSLRSTADPARFPEGGEAWQRAKRLSRRLDAARNILMENIDPTVRRFERLEID